MRRIWTRLGIFTLLSAALVSGCGRPNSQIELNQASAISDSDALQASEPRRFQLPKYLAILPIEEAADCDAGRVQTTSNEEGEASSPPSVLKKQGPRPLPSRHRTEGDFDVVETQARQLIEQAFRLADRGAIYSARSDLMTALQRLCDAQDTIHGNRRSTKAFQAALIAMEEAGDFVITGEVRKDLQRVIEGHQTQVLKDATLDRITHILAMQQYYSFAQEQLIEAANGSRAASEALCGLGKVARRLPTTDSASPRNALVKALVYQQSAIAIDENNFHAKNELGVLYAQLNRPRDAVQFLHEVALATNWPTAWANLARVHTQLNEHDLAERALTESRLASKANIVSKGPVEFAWVSPEEFIAEADQAAPRSLATRPQSATRR
jgi:tetratricopeptide (TPR) repeat protein